MNFDKEKIEFLKRINLPHDSKERLKDLNTFFDFYSEIVEKHKSCPEIVYPYSDMSGINMNNSDFYKIIYPHGKPALSLKNKSIIISNSEEIFPKVISFIELWNYLEKYKLIRTIEKHPNDIKNFVVPLTNETYEHSNSIYNRFNDKLWILIKEYVLLEIFPLPELEVFIEKNCESAEISSKDSKLTNNTMVRKNIFESLIERYKILLQDATYQNRYKGDYQTLKIEAETIIEKIFGEEGLKKYTGSPMPGVYFLGSPINEKKELQDYIDEIEKIINKLEGYKNLTNNISNEETVNFNQNIIDIFIVHGHSEEMKQTVARLLEKQDIMPIILHEKPNKGKTIIDKFESNSNVDTAIILLSGDDYGFSKGTDSKNAKLRPRQNVIFELGYFLGKIGRDKVICLYEKEIDIEIFSDFSGVLYIEYGNSNGWKVELGKELKEIGFNFDLNKI